MCMRSRRRRDRFPTANRLPYEGETTRLSARPRRCAHAHWHLLWLLVPLFFVGDSLLEAARETALVLAGALWQPTSLEITPLPMLLIGAGLLLLWLTHEPRD